MSKQFINGQTAIIRFATKHVVKSISCRETNQEKTVSKTVSQDMDEFLTELSESKILSSISSLS